MARKTVKETALGYAKNHGLVLSVDYELIEISGYEAKIHNDAGGHLDSVRWDEYKTEPSAWRAALIAMKNMVEMNSVYAPCECECYNK